MENNVDHQKIKELEQKIKDLNNLLENKDQEKKNIQDLYTKEIKTKLEQNNQKILEMRNSHLDEIHSLQSEFDKKIEKIQKENDQEKSELKNSLMNLEKELILSNRKFNLTEKAEIKEFQKKYLTEMQELQKSFEEFKLKTYKEMKILRKQKDEAYKTANIYEQNIERMQIDWEQNENIFRENYRNMKNKLDSLKVFIKNNEILKNQMELKNSEISFLRLKVNKLENSEKNLQAILLEKSFIPMGSNMGSIGSNTIGGINNHGHNIGNLGNIGGNNYDLNNFTNSDGFFNSNNANNKSDYSDLNLIPMPHYQSPNPYNLNKNNYNSSNYNNGNYMIQPFHNQSIPKKRSNSKSIGTNSSKLNY